MGQGVSQSREVDRAVEVGFATKTAAKLRKVNICQETVDFGTIERWKMFK